MEQGNQGKSKMEQWGKISNGKGGGNLKWNRSEGKFYKKQWSQGNLKWNGGVKSLKSKKISK